MVAHFECTVILIHTRLHDIFANKSHCFGCCCGIVIILCVLSAYLAHFCHCLVVVLCTHACCYCVSLFVAVAFGLGVHISVFAIALFAAQLLTRICSIQDWGRIHLANEVGQIHPHLWSLCAAGHEIRVIRFTAFQQIRIKLDTGRFPLWSVRVYMHICVCDCLVCCGGC